MNRSSLKKFATWARSHLREQVTAKAARFGITAQVWEAPQYVGGGMSVAGHTYDAPTTSIYNALRVSFEPRLDAGASQKAITEALIDEMAYTWFNRLCALRYMEVQGYQTRALSSSTPGAVDPDILRDASALVQGGDLHGVSMAELERWRTQGDNLTYRNLLIAQCRTLAQSLPFLFEGKDYVALFLPDNLLTSQSIVRRIVADIPEDDWQHIEIIGWLYQFYIAERKDQVFASKGAVPARDIPAATQLFTPHWIVRYMVENSLGRLWLESHPNSKLREKMPYYLEASSASASADNGMIRQHPPLQPQDLTVIDPACGSGHILVYAFDLLMEIYLEAGYPERDIPALILSHNLFGLDIDQRAAQLASFALMMKARARSRRILREPPPLHVTHLAPSRGFPLPDAPQLKRDDWQPLIDAFKDADNLGSLIRPPDFDSEALAAQLSAYEASGRLDVHIDAPRLRQLLKQAELLLRRYQAVVANPPYMGNKSLNATLKDFAQTNYQPYKHDLFSVSVVRYIEMCDTRGHLGFMTPFVWMFISSYEALRTKVIEQHTMTSLVQLEYSGFDGATVPICTYTLRKDHIKGYKGEFVRLTDFRGADNQGPKVLEAAANPDCGFRYHTAADDFEKIPGSPIAYWVSEKVLEAFSREPTLHKFADPRVGLDTGKNDRYIRCWYEIPYNQIGFKHKSSRDFHASRSRYVPHTKGGSFRKWYGNFENVLRFDLQAYRELEMSGNHLPSRQFYFKEGASWTRVSSGSFSIRYTPYGFVFNSACPTIIAEPSDLRLCLSFLSSNVSPLFLAAMSPTLNFQAGEIRQLPLSEKSRKPCVDICESAIEVSKTDWDNFETSWDFQGHPLLRYGTSRLQDAFDCWQKEADEAFFELKRLEEENNRYWIEAYGLQGELSAEVPEDQITIRRADLVRDMKSLLSFAVGCMLGRYSLAAPGLQFAGGVFDRSAFSGEFLPDKSGIIPVTDAPYFEDDVVSQFETFLRVAFGAEYLEDNLAFVADALTRRAGEGARERIRRYFVSEFVKDHNRSYSKRPIYWLFSSGKTGAFGALIYLHRYQPDTLARMRNDYVLPLQGKLDAAMQQAQLEQDQAESASLRRAAERKVTALREQYAELLAFQERLQQASDQRIQLDLDDGVAYNYTLFEGLLYEGPDLKMADLRKHSQWKRELLAQN